MMHALLFTVSIIASGVFNLCLAAPTDLALSSPKPECDEPSDEFFYLVQQWPAGYCAESHCSRTPPASKFTIHGFWPNYCKDRSGKEWPQFCSREKLDLQVLDDLIPTLQSEWPSYSMAHAPWHSRLLASTRSGSTSRLSCSCIRQTTCMKP